MLFFLLSFETGRWPGASPANLLPDRISTLFVIAHFLLARFQGRETLRFLDRVKKQG